MADTVRDNRATVDPFSQPLEGNIVESPDLFDRVRDVRDDRGDVLMKPITPWLLGALLALTACTPEDSTETARRPQDTASISAQYAWDESPQEDRDAMCLGLYAYGRDWAVQEIRRGADRLTEQDALVAVALITRECDAR